MITAPGVESFREYVLFIQNGIRLLDVKGNLIQTVAEDSGEPVDPEDTGEKGYNYHSERFANRLARNPRVWKVFSSKVHGDPATPVWKAYPGDRVIFRTMMPADKPRIPPLRFMTICGGNSGGIRFPESSPCRAASASAISSI